MPEIDRQAARVLVISPRRRVLLLRVEPTFRPAFWVTPGGGLDDGETFEHAAARELREEVGRDDLPIGPLLWQEHVEFTWEEWFVRQDERTFLVEVPEEFAPTIVDPGIEPLTGGAWFSVEELRSMNGRPRRLSPV